MTDNSDLLLAKITWTDPTSGAVQEHVLVEGATASIGRSSSNDICIPEHHVSRQHAVINYRDGIFMISDLGSANGTFVNDEKIDEPFPLFSGDTIRLYIPTLSFSAALEEDRSKAEESGTLITANVPTGKGKLIITSGQQEGQVIPMLLEEITVGRATTNATWEIGLQDPAVSRPHARFARNDDDTWVLYDMGSSNGTRINNTPVTEQGRPLRDGDILTIGTTLILYRVG